MTRRLLVLSAFAGLLPWTARPATALSIALPLPELVQRSSLIARVRVIETRPAPVPNRYRSLAKVRLLEVLRGEPGADVVQVRFDNGYACPNVHFEKGEECLLFAEQEIDGCFLTVNWDNGKKAVDEAGYPQLREEIRRLTIRSRHAVSVSVAGGRGGSHSLKATVINQGVGAFVFTNNLHVEFRAPGREELLKIADDGPSIIVQLDKARAVRGLEELRRHPTLELEPGEACQATLDLKDLLPAHLTGKHTVRAWAKVLGSLSEPVLFEVDLGNAPRMEKLERAEELSLEDRSRKAPPGPFQLTPGTRLRRFARRNLSPILVLCAAASCLLPLWVAAGWRRGRARRPVVLPGLSIGILASWTGTATADSYRALSLPDLVQGSALIARVEVVGIRPEHSRATVRLLEVLRGEREAELIEVGFGDLDFERGEQCLLFARAHRRQARSGPPTGQGAG